MNKFRILIIEDEADIIEIIQDFIDNADFEAEATYCQNGIQAAIQCHNNEKFDLIISDQHMPYLDGLSFLKYLRKEDSKNLATPFVFLSAYISNVQSIIEENDNVHFMNKPISFEELSEKIKSFLI